MSLPEPIQRSPIFVTVVGYGNSTHPTEQRAAVELGRALANLPASLAPPRGGHNAVAQGYQSVGGHLAYRQGSFARQRSIVIARCTNMHNLHDVTDALIHGETVVLLHGLDSVTQALGDLSAACEREAQLHIASDPEAAIRILQNL